MPDFLKRYIEPVISDDLERKMVFISGPRQTGKTTFAKNLLAKKGHAIKKRYLNWDATVDREKIIREQFPIDRGLLVLDEIHKYTRWRQVIKGLYDTRGDELQILITGSARLDHYRHGGDSLQGRFHFHRLHPLTFAEIDGKSRSDLNDLLAFGGFPEPFFLGSEKQTRRWSREYRTRLVRDDLNNLEKVRDISFIEHLAIRLPDLVGSPLSINSLREDLQVSHQSVSRWIQMLENLYLIFRLPPFGAPKIKAVKKEAKHYHFDWTVVKAKGIRFENLTACHLLKWCHFLADSDGFDIELRYFRDIDLREVDFVVVKDQQPIHFIECKKSYKRANRGLRYLKQKFPDTPATQITLEENIAFQDRDGIQHLSATDFFATLK